MKFTKMHGLGNDYVYVNGFSETVADPAEAARRVADRHFGIGGDGLILILPSDKADVRMRMFNADGSEGEMCGNGVRCVAKYAYDHQLSKSNPMRIETGRGVLTLDLTIDAGKVTTVTVNMASPILTLPEIPVDASQLKKGLSGKEWQVLAAAPGDYYKTPLEMTFVSMGNPHAVTFVEDVKAVELERLGK